MTDQASALMAAWEQAVPAAREFVKGYDEREPPKESLERFIILADAVGRVIDVLESK